LLDLEIWEAIGGEVRFQGEFAAIQRRPHRQRRQRLPTAAWISPPTRAVTSGV